MVGHSQITAEWLLISGGDVPSELSPDLSLVQTGDFKQLLRSEFTCNITGANCSDAEDTSLGSLKKDLDYGKFVEMRIATQFSEVSANEKAAWLLRLMCVGLGAFRAFLQSNVTGPPLNFSPEAILLPLCLTGDTQFTDKISKASILSLTVDGESAYHLTPNVILLVLAKTILNSPLFSQDDAPQTTNWWRLRVNFLHQRILSEKTGTLYDSIMKDIALVAQDTRGLDDVIIAMFCIEKAMVYTYFGNDAKALKELETSAKMTGLSYALTGVMGKRTQFQQKDTSQLVVLAKSAAKVDRSEAAEPATKPETLDLNDDTLLESISFTDTTTIKDDKSLPANLAGLDPADQPALEPLDAAILLLLTETIKNTNPADGITREQMLPYAERVLSHSTNWEVYTLGLLVRSRLEGSRSRTMERGLLQLQAVVDQVIAETTIANASGNAANHTGISTFLPRAKETESASVRERLLYIHQLPMPTRWEIEAELASLWTHVGGLNSALEIYERLEMWPELALCYAATEKEDKARDIIRNQLVDMSTGDERSPVPSEAARMWCILGDIEQDISHYEKAWEVSGGRYARAQRSLGRHYFGKRDYERAAESYGKSLKIYPLHPQGWFALGCCWLELQKWEGAVRAFGRVVGLDESDAEAWSNLATALLRRENFPEKNEQQMPLDDEQDDGLRSAISDPQRNKKDAMRALKRAANLKRESWRIWDNYLTVAASLEPPAYNDVVIAMKRIIEIRKDSKGEVAVDADIAEILVRHIITADQDGKPSEYNPSKGGLPKAVVELVEKYIVPLITTNPRLWRIVARLELWMKRPKASLEAHEKAWRAINGRPGITDGTEQQWNELVDETIDLVDAYENLGQMERTEGLGSGEPVAKDWRFKARSSVRAVIGKGKNWEGTNGWNRLKDALEGLKV
ncbi:hypothetical protein EDC01DRAFT_628518 [Geopyxis carbonaria]|nr:hypothetical protein EDC01DRAFT_628518 [Geopyxis carbonaria]